jgi:hypothetical protein
MPLYRQQGWVRALSDGTHRVELLGRDGVRLATYSFSPLDIVDAPEKTWGFSLSLPYVTGLPAFAFWPGWL